MATFGVWLQYSGGGSTPSGSLGGQVGPVDTSMVFSQAVSYVSGDSITGILVLGSRNQALGNGTLDFNYGTGTLSWTENGGSPVYEALGADGFYNMFVGNKIFVFKLTNSLLPTSNKTGTYAVADRDVSIFDNVSFPERSSNHTNYRCLYLRNNFSTDLSNVSVFFPTPPTYGTITVGSEYLKLAKTVSNTYVENVALIREYYSFTAYGGLVGAPSDVFSWERGYYQGASESGAIAQNSNGVDTDLPFTVVDEVDSTGILANVSFYSSLQWPTIAANSYVSFWLKRYVPAGESGTGVVPDNFTMQVSFGR